MEAEGKNMIYFQLQEGARARRYLWSQPDLKLLDINMGAGGTLLCCLVPEYDMGSRRWDSEKLTQCLNRILVSEGQEYSDYYLQPELGSFMGIVNRLPPTILLHKLLIQVPCWEYLFYISGTGETEESGGMGFRSEEIRKECELLLELLEEYLPRINHVTLLAEPAEEYKELAEFLYEEYGIPTAFMDRMERRLGRDGRTVILDGKRDYKIPYSVIPKDAAYVDLWSVNKKKKIIEKMRKDIGYVSTVKFLDTLVKNRYNTIVN